MKTFPFPTDWSGMKIPTRHCVFSKEGVVIVFDEVDEDCPIQISTTSSGDYAEWLEIKDVERVRDLLTEVIDFFKEQPDEPVSSCCGSGPRQPGPGTAVEEPEPQVYIELGTLVLLPA
jgi:hypothetical protein